MIDLDSAASAIAYAYLASQSSQDKRQYAALYRQNIDDLRLRQENVLAFQESSILPEDMIFLDDMSTFELNALGVSFVLVDHNHRSPEFGDGHVSGIIDHHADEGFHEDASPRVITVPTGSCSSLVTLHFAQSLSPHDIPQELANLLIS